MTKPTTYYASDRDGFFDGLVEQYGNQLQKIDINEKLFMISAIAAMHFMDGCMGDALSILDDGEDAPQEIRDILYSLEQMDYSAQFGFMEALLAQSKEQYRLQVEFLRQISNAGVSADLAEEVSCIIAAGGERTDEQIAVVSQAWGQIVGADPMLAERIELLMTAE
ncbi:hypothetical protein H6F88_18015 [Oculatella sp. FACHB-28]|uniref:hypothetical protein n=1 Tax=Oculatella sp. FACHB-28 TaxID=2692845 RepID=UPI0016884C9E|nr:hypothetical protein [Oculatella sp. FACHB-28]MBD2057892.1 hypothetical protein [Oculatella sp. FACHB-28]